MANEVTVSATLRYSKTPVSASLATTFSVDQTGSHFIAATESVGTVEEQLDKNDITTIGYIAIRNLDATNFVQMGSSTGAYSFKLEAGKGALIPWNSSTAPYVKADTAACLVDYLFIEK